jgi:hypothetical protein
MDLPAEVPDEPGEAELLYLADKLTSGVGVVGLERKEERAAELFTGDEAALAGARRRLGVARGLAARVEALAGRSLAAIIDGGRHGTGGGPAAGSAGPASSGGRR